MKNDSRAFRGLAWLLFVAVPLNAGYLWRVWSQIPPVLATHYDSSGHPRAWEPRGTVAFWFLGALAAIALIACLASYLTTPKAWVPSGYCWLALGGLYVIASAVCGTEKVFLNYEMYGVQYALPPHSRATFLVPDPFVFLVALITIAVLVGWRLWGWAQE